MMKPTRRRERFCGLYEGAGGKGVNSSLHRESLKGGAVSSDFPWPKEGGRQMLRKCVLLFVVFTTILSLFACGGTSPTVTFQDANLEAAVRQAIGKPEGAIYASDLEELTSFHAPGRGITDLSGLQHFANLTELNLGDNEIKDVSPLSHLTKLTRLNLVANKISDISSLSSLNSLTKLLLDDNQISDISALAFLANLKELRLTGNPLSATSVDVYIPSLQQRGVQVASVKPVSTTTTTPSPPTTTTTPPVTIVASDTWKLSGSLYLLTSQGTTDYVSTYLKSFGFTPGFLGGSLSYVYSRLATHWGEIQTSNTIILFNASSEQLSILADWPDQYKEICPFTNQELTGINLPFALLKRQDNGLIRAIILANSEPEIITILGIMKDKPAPVNVPWTVSNNQIIDATTGGGSALKETKEISDTNFRIFYPEGYETDASNMITWANQVVTVLQKWFPDLLSVIGGRVIIEMKDTGDPGYASADPSRPSITFVTPSVAAKVSSYYDADWYLGNIAHEISHIIFDKYRKIAGGYQRTDCPNWFDEGFGEYLRLLVIGEQRFDANYSWYVPEINNIIANGLSGISDADVYAGGAWVLRFMDSKFGINTIKAIITSKQETFWAAVTEQTNLTQSQFEEQLIRWLKELPQP